MRPPRFTTVTGARVDHGCVIAVGIERACDPRTGHVGSRCQATQRRVPAVRGQQRDRQLKRAVDDDPISDETGDGEGRPARPRCGRDFSARPARMPHVHQRAAGLAGLERHEAGPRDGVPRTSCGGPGRCPLVDHPAGRISLHQQVPWSTYPTAGGAPRVRAASGEPDSGRSDAVVDWSQSRSRT